MEASSPLGGQPRISVGGGGRQGGWGGVRAIPSPKRCSPRRLGLANSYSAVAGWACGTERPDMAADAPAAPVRGAAPTGAAGPLQLPRSRGAAGVGAGSTPPKIVRSPGGGAASARDQRVTRAAWTPVPSPAHPSAVTSLPLAPPPPLPPAPGQLGVGAGERAGVERLLPTAGRGLAETLPNSWHVFLHLLFYSPVADNRHRTSYSSPLGLRLCQPGKVKDANNFPPFLWGWGDEPSPPNVRVLSEPSATQGTTWKPATAMLVVTALPQAPTKS